MAKKERLGETVTPAALETFLQDRFKKAWEERLRLSEECALYEKGGKEHLEHEDECRFVVQSLKKRRLVIYGEISAMEELGKHFGIRLEEPDGISG